MSLLATSNAFGHEPAKGLNGGLRVDAGKYHTELLVDGTPTVVVYLSDVNDNPIAAKDFKANAIFVIDGKSQRFPLSPVDGSKLVGIAPTAVKPGVKGAIQLTAPDGETVQGKF
ncbi:MAG: hypothetical protein HOO99_01805 [Hyphomicrobiaceae bacterium]|nr:hypothetical protein [Hyphomicrobiaceae bacterium]